MFSQFNKMWSAPVASEVRTDQSSSVLLPSSGQARNDALIFVRRLRNRKKGVCQYSIGDIIGGKRIYSVVAKTMKINFGDKIKVYRSFANAVS